MITIYFFYGLSFLVMGIIILSMAKKEDFFYWLKDIWLLGLFGITHGLNEWIELLILSEGPYSSVFLRLLNHLLLPGSFVFLAAFGCQALSRIDRRMRWLHLIWVSGLLGWVLGYIKTREFLIPGILARYFICFPGTIFSAMVFSLVIFRQRSIKLSKIVMANLWLIILIFPSYGFLSGLVTPEANFLLAQTLNYEKFKYVTGIPVQFFRMVCAIFLTVGFGGISSLFIYSGQELKIRGGIKMKFVLLIVALGILILGCGIGMTYRTSYQILRRTIIQNYLQIAQMTARTVEVSFDNDVKNIEERLKSTFWRSPVIESNLKYVSLSSRQIQGYLLAIDQEWIKAPQNDLLVKNYLGNQMSVRLFELAEHSENIGEIFLTDQYGGLVAASGKTSDFYQADEEWWQKTYADGKGRVYFGSVEIDASTGVKGLTVGLPIKKNNGEVIGVCKMFIDINHYFTKLENFKIGKTGHAMLLDQDGSMLYDSDLSALDRGKISQAEFKRISENTDGWFILERAGSKGEQMFMAFSVVDFEKVVEEKRVWRVLIGQSVKEVFGPLDRLFFRYFIVVIVMVIIMSFLGVIFGERLSKPIVELSRAAGHISEGNLDYRIHIRSNDEIGQLAQSFNQMAVKLKELYSNMENQIRRRTSQLGEAKEILERRVEELEQINKVTIGRELKMVELKKEIERLKEKSNEKK
ncbi:MAG: hypothetical protein A3G33_06190 [Omnitrophica bacterium RIFCSPLOWO2_12_FULL_44_17]|uniref:histidine kinase n=1 Tax=Candidatus Danuiimicrobium aquiferis TaxID=1801832 RepID=A0A1G1KR43_9BACT|nr:MAG: hypothetical protein A3B72_02675 [Omnitrophica bacterium RIFCSPHIGHO2_02_FULL_45_28]OGW88075.1 MAG: hypothetical protein A3E74_00605 [Omnitrophica bacterium RIFCSPHIGHO2_12_FULL_44_12]OGW95373.1 MAG: hypothetical protein A3G33_06190 [Omnitrophica bacterium RIFCSPLOWO2_12_FULL_44_17]OGX04075.1 MAG: hypothetical protein A3J12_08755 [Omnitrophica bacterium RIFCSPLOWO2_02_FULL_44_11]